jgi:hypothetical protein
MMIKALTIKRSGYTFGRPGPRFLGDAVMGMRSTSITNVTSNGFWCSIQLPPGVDVSQLKYYGGRRALASPQRGVSFPASGRGLINHEL